MDVCDAPQIFVQVVPIEPAADGGTEIEVTTIDDVVGEERVMFIKMNIEGAEIDALKGATRTIRRWRPKLAISAYHRPSDLWRIPRLVRHRCRPAVDYRAVPF
jgi:hypothetical protein